MPDTGAPWNIPYVAGTDLVSDWPTDSQTLAEAVADGLDAAGGLVAVKHVLKTDTWSASVTAGASSAVTDLSITHTLADAANKLIITAFFGAASTSTNGGQVGIAVADDGTLIAIGDAAGTRVRTSAGGRVGGTSDASITFSPSITFVYAPGDTASHTYTVNAQNINTGTQTLYVNRSVDDVNAATRARTASAFVIQEIKV
jgi:hypothetical protein